MELNAKDSHFNFNEAASNKQFFLLAGPCVIEGEQMALDIAGKILETTRGTLSAS